MASIPFQQELLSRVVYFALRSLSALLELLPPYSDFAGVISSLDSPDTWNGICEKRFSATL
jgi:hypothetical protein